MPDVVEGAGRGSKFAREMERRAMKNRENATRNKSEGRTKGRRYPVIGDGGRRTDWQGREERERVWDPPPAKIISPPPIPPHIGMAGPRGRNGGERRGGWRGGMPREKRPTPPPSIIPPHSPSLTPPPQSLPPGRIAARNVGNEGPARTDLRSSAMRDVGSGVNERCCVGMFQSVLAGSMAKPTPRTPHGNSFSPLME